MSIVALRGRWMGPSLSTAIAAMAVFALAPLLGWTAATERWLEFALLVAVAATPVLIRWPVASTMGLYALVLPFEAVAGVGGGATLARLIGMLAVGVLFVVGLNERRLVRPPSAALWWGLLVLWGGLTAAWAIEPQISISRLYTAISLFLLFLIGVSFRVSRTELNGVCILTVVGGVAAAIAGYALGVEEFEAGRRGTLSVGDTSANPNGFASSLLPAMAFGVAAFLRLRGLAVKTIALAATAILAAGMYITISRSALLAVVVLIGVMVYRFHVSWRVLVLVGILVGLLGFMPEHFFARMTAPVTGADPTGSGRTEIWSIGLNALDEFWMWGAGLSNFTSAYARYTTIPPTHIARGAHNLYLGTWVELGIVGLVIMLVAISSQLRVAWRCRRSNDLVLYAVEAAIYGHLILAFFGDPLWGKRQWMLFMMLAWASRLATESSREPAWGAEVSRLAPAESPPPAGLPGDSPMPRVSVIGPTSS